jgi:uncharacterized protein (TIGR03067 family)
MKFVTSWALVLFAFSTLALAQDEKAAKEPINIEGKYTLVSGKKLGAEPDAEAKNAEYVITKDRITIKGKEATFVIAYTLSNRPTPATIDMEILDGPGGTKGSKAQGIVQKNGDELKIAYSLDNKRPKDFEGKDGMLFVFKKTK